jgi:hypothetical protein
MSLRRIWIPSPNYSSRQGAATRLVVIHTAEGALTFESLGNYFKGNVSASSHTGIDDTPGTIGEYVKRPNKAWTAANANPVAVQTELCAFAKWTPEEWSRHPVMLENCAAWVAEECAYFGIPITKLTASQAQGSGRGVCQHNDLGSWGGGHWDAGPGFPMDQVLEMARSGGGAPAQPTQEADDMIASAVADNGTLHVFEANAETVFYTYQPKNKSAWSGGEAGKQVAKLSPFTSAPSGKKIRALTAEKASNGALHLFVEMTDSSVFYTWQPKGSSAWNGGAPGKGVAGLTALAPKP